MNGGTPLPSLGPLNLVALRLAEGVTGPRGPIDPTVAQLLATLLEAGPDGLLFQLADGRRFAAEGDLPYPPGTQLTLKVQTLPDGTVQLQPTEAEPPPPSALLAALPSEAADLMARLAAPQSEPGLVALQRLFRLLQPAPPPEAEALLTTLQEALPQGEASGGPVDLARQLQAAGWPEGAAGAWQRLFPAATEAGASATAQPLAHPPAALLKALGLPEALAPGAAREGASPLPPDLLLRARDILAKLPQPLAQRTLALLTLLPATPQGQPQALAADHPLARLLQALLPELREALTAAGRPGGPGLPAQADPAEPATWGGWIRGVIETLGRPESSPAQAPAHALQAREGTGLFQVPLPWADPQGPLEVWAEREPDPGGRGEVHRVLLAVSFRQAGDLRIGLQSGPGGVQARIYAPEDRAARLADALRTELGDPAPFPVSVRGLPSPPPRPLALADRGLQALG